MARRKRPGKVYLIGAGPGHPKLITLRAIECLQEADVVVYDHLANQKFLQYAKKRCEIVYAGKTGVHHTLHQEEINRILVEQASAGRTVARLKGGDPLLYGRGGEEAEEMGRRGIPFEIVPGVPAALAAAAYAGIPLTHRHHASTVAFVTGHEGTGKGGPPVDWERLAAGAGTLVIYMGVGNLEENVRKLLAHGRAPETPAALVRWASTPDQVTVTGTLADIAPRARRAGLKAPAVMIVGPVVGLRPTLAWAERLPLFGRRIVLTRFREEGGRFARDLERAGAEVYYLPAIRIAPPADFEAVDRAIDRLASFHWLIFTSANGVRGFLDRLLARGRDARALHGLKICTVGTATAQVLHERGLHADLIPAEFHGEGIAAALVKQAGVRGRRILLPRAEQAREILPQSLRRAGAEVAAVPVYRNEVPRIDPHDLEEILVSRRAHLIVFTSPSNFRNLLAAAEEHGLRERLQGIRIACIGPVTAKAVRSAGLAVDLQPEVSTLEALAAAILQFFGGRGMVEGVTEEVPS